MINLIVQGNPASWKHHKGYGKRAYDPRANEKFNAKLQIKSQYKDEIIKRPVILKFEFFMPIPESASAKQKELMRSGKVFHTKRPDATNLQKLYEDVLKGIVIHDDAQAVGIMSMKQYHDQPHTKISVLEIKENSH